MHAFIRRRFVQFLTSNKRLLGATFPHLMWFFHISTLGVVMMMRCDDDALFFSFVFKRTHLP
jgi:lipid-A-disaccharide synthase-like uncharacterized protein